MLLIDLSHTSHSRAQTGVQRVCRGLYRELKKAHPTEPVTYDPYAQTWRPLQLWELSTLHSSEVARKRKTRWPLAARWRGRFARLTRRGVTTLPRADSLIVPEIFSPAVGANLPSVFRAVHGPKIAVFHDAIALKYPELTPHGTVARFPGYLRELLAFDGVAAVSADSAQSLAEYWRWLGVNDTPEVVHVSLPLLDWPEVASAAPAKSPPVVLCVGSIEGRKNHVALLEACEKLWNEGLSFELRLIGLHHPTTGKAALEKIRALTAARRPVRYDGPVDDATLRSAYAECLFTVYPSLIEGFGLPVLESLAHGKPCICSSKGALGESASGGGCLALDAVDAANLAGAIGGLIRDGTTLDRLRAEARARTFRTWADYVRELTGWMSSLQPRPST
jgi:glycosyltransferase involved in cell wall biosynthesis